MTWEAISIKDESAVDISECYVDSCGFADEGGAILVEDSAVNISDCVFVGNSAAFGGAVFMIGGSVTDSIFYDNSAGMATGGLHASASTEVTGCVFVNNQMWGLGGSPHVTDSIFSLNGGGMLACNGAEVSRCLFGGSSVWAPSGIAEIADSVFGGCGISCGDTGYDTMICPGGTGWPEIRNATIVRSYAVTPATGCSPTMYGSISWDHYGTGGDVLYSLVEGGVSGEGNLDVNPLFAGYPLSTGTWSEVFWDEGLFQTELTDASASWTPGELASLLIDPDLDDPSDRMAVIADNTETVVWIWGNAGFVEPGDSYELIDLHLQAGSPAIDAGYGMDASELDADGNPRWDDPDAGNAFDCAPDAGPECVEFVDMGAYERQE